MVGTIQQMYWKAHYSWCTWEISCTAHPQRPNPTGPMYVFSWPQSYKGVFVYNGISLSAISC